MKDSSLEQHGQRTLQSVDSYAPCADGAYESTEHSIWITEHSWRLKGAMCCIHRQQYIPAASDSCSERGVCTF